MSDTMLIIALFSCCIETSSTIDDTATHPEFDWNVRLWFERWNPRHPETMDLFGVLVLAVVAALGGGMMRDVPLGHTPPRDTQ